jgi:hypothetical protein
MISFAACASTQSLPTGVCARARGCVCVFVWKDTRAANKTCTQDTRSQQDMSPTNKTCLLFPPSLCPNTLPPSLSVRLPGLTSASDVEQSLRSNNKDMSKSISLPDFLSFWIQRDLTQEPIAQTPPDKRLPSPIQHLPQQISPPTQTPSALAPTRETPGSGAANASSSSDMWGQTSPIIARVDLSSAVGSANQESRDAQEVLARSAGAWEDKAHVLAQAQMGTSGADLREERVGNDRGRELSTSQQECVGNGREFSGTPPGDSLRRTSVRVPCGLIFTEGLLTSAVRIIHSSFLVLALFLFLFHAQTHTQGSPPARQTPTKSSPTRFPNPILSPSPPQPTKAASEYQGVEEREPNEQETVSSLRMAAPSSLIKV